MTEPAFLQRAVGWVFSVGGAIGLLAAFVLSVERVKLLEDPDYVPTCSINPVLSCGSVMQTDQASAFGFPNPFLGIAGFAAVAALGVALVGGAQLPRWLWRAVLGGLAFAVGFVHWLIFQSLYRIGALCPYCMVVWAVTVPIFWYALLQAASAGHVPLPGRVVQTAARFHGALLTMWFLAVTAVIGEQFWAYWRTLL